jgi:hypothetical protein
MKIVRFLLDYIEYIIGIKLYLYQIGSKIKLFKQFQ